MGCADPFTTKGWVGEPRQCPLECESVASYLCHFVLTCGCTFRTTQAEAVFAAYLGRGRQDHAYGKHAYTFEQFGLSKSEVRSATKAYVEQLGIEEEI